MIRQHSGQLNLHGENRRGVVLVVVLAMLGLLAVIGVTFATYSNQAQIASRRFIANTKANVDPDSLLNYALEQLINDTNNRLSSLRGHSLKRDMYGNDSVFHGIVTTVPDITATNFPKPQIPPMITSVGAQVFQDPVTGQALVSPARIVQTNIPVTGTPFDGYDFTRWVMKIAVCGGFDSLGRPINQNPAFLSQTIEVLNGVWHSSLQAGGYRALLIAEPDLTTGLAQVVNGMFFSLDGRFLRSFNGSGVTYTQFPGSTVVHDWGKYPNLRLNAVSSVVDPRTGEFLPSGLPTNPDFSANPGYDEDYDAADLENWFLALQSADGSITLPSFHRPGIITYDTSQMAANPAWYLANNDWQVRLAAGSTAAQMAAYAASASKFLRPRAADGHDRMTFPDLVPDLRPTLANGTTPNPTYGQLGYFDTDTTGIPAGQPDNWKFNPGFDVDNDGDGYKESVWIDLGFPVQTDPNGKKYKPLFAFMVVGLNGRLPLNTAGNLHDRNIGVDVADRDFGPPVVSMAAPGAQQFNHASHLGTSPTEINPKFALRNSNSLGNNSAALEVQSTLGLRGLLAGNRSGTQPILGRWGDEKNLQTYINAVPGVDIRADAFLNPVRAGKSMIDSSQIAGYTPPSYASTDATDDDGDAFDFLASSGAGPLAPTLPQVYSNERGDGTYPAASNNLMLGVERQRRFVTPTDPLGVGKIVAWNRQPLFYPNYLVYEQTAAPGADLNTVGNQLGAVSWFGRGADSYGRIGYFGYYRPPGISTPELLPPFDNNQTFVDIALHQFLIGTVNYNEPGSYLNPTHGYESFRNPLMTLENEANGLNGGGFNAGMPYNFGNNWENGTWPANLPTQLPYPFGNIMTLPNNTLAPATWPANNLRGTFTGNIASDNTTVNNFMPGVSSGGGLLNRDEADEQNLYDSSDQFDSPFRATDLADFYLADSSYDDKNSGNRIVSRITQLAPESLGFVASPQPTYSTSPNIESFEVQQWKRWPVNPRKLFAHESWDINRFSWANDNPCGIFGTPGSTAGNANFFANQSASLPNLSYNAAGNFYQFPMPSIAAGDRRINLNFPLPAYDYQSTPAIARYQEPTRLKWLRETYQLMLRVLPPKAVDTALEKAQLAQYLVNVIDYRDPDGVMTLFTAIDPNTGAVGHGLYETIATPGSPSVVVEGVPPLYAQPANTIPLNLWGMEYQPIALNEVLAYEFKYWGSDGKGAETSQRRIFIEMVNTLTASQYSGGDVAVWDPSDQNMYGWDFVVAQDADQNGIPDATGRPSPITGQLPVDSSGTPLGKIGSVASVPVAVSGVAGGAPLPIGKEVKAMRWDAGANSSFPVYSVFANPPASVAVEIQSPDTYVAANPKAVYNRSGEFDKLLPPVGEVTDTEQGRYFWLYLRRPSDPSDPTSPKVVVDSIRFPYMVSDGKSDANAMNPTITETTIHLYSSQRMQPYRGGHAVANVGTTPYFPLNAYGYSEQSTVSDARSSSDPNNHSIGYSGGKNLVSDRKLRHTIGTTNTNNEDWQLTSFLDRDFQSLAEMLMVPGVGPGQFTKLFVENNPAFGKGQRNPTPPVKPKATPPNNGDTASASNNWKADEGDRLRSTPSFPYLVDKFYYTAAPQVDYLSTYSTIPDQSGSALSITVPPVLVPDATGMLYGSPSADGWHKMLEFFEVPSSMNGAIGPVTDGENGDWFRQMRVPGKINLNLVVDEEVFMGLIDDSRVNLKEVDTVNGTDALPSVAVGQAYISTANQFTPLSMVLPNRGYADDPLTRSANTPLLSPTPMKRVFSDFLKLRHGGSGTLLGFGQGQTGMPNARELPYRSLSFPDVNYTLLRPGALTPSGNPASANNGFATIPGFKQDTNGVLSPPSTSSRLLNTGLDPRFWFVHNYQVDITNDPNYYGLAALPGAIGGGDNPPYLGNPGIRNIFLDYAPSFSYAQPPSTPFRRLFQIPDTDLGFVGGQRDWDRNSHASLFGNPFVNQMIWHNNLSTTNTTFGAVTEQLDNQTPYKRIFPPASLFVARDPAWVPGVNTTAIFDFAQISNTAAIDPTLLPRPLLGANIYQDPNVNGMGALQYNTVADRRQHPFFRNEILEKLMNSTTVRTQQFAVYVTVGFFEVKSEGNANTLQPDILGAEIDANNRYTVFAVIDRTKAEGFNPINPGNYRDLVDYSRRLK